MIPRGFTLKAIIVPGLYHRGSPHDATGIPQYFEPRSCMYISKLCISSSDSRDQCFMLYKVIWAMLDENKNYRLAHLLGINIP